MNKWFGKISTRLILIGLSYYGLFHLQSQLYYMLSNDTLVKLLDDESPFYVNSGIVENIIDYSSFLYYTIPFIFFLPEIIKLSKKGKPKKEKKSLFNFKTKK